MIVRIAALITLVVMGAAAPASAHSGSNASENLRTEVVTVPAGLEAQVHADGSLITVRAADGVTAVVTGYQDEPFLRLVGEQVFTNTDSLTTYDVQSGVLTEIPATAGAGKVAWRSVADPGWFAWPDHRIAWDGAELPSAVMDDPGHAHHVADWSIPVTVDGHSEVISGRVVWDPPAGGQWFTITVLVGLIALVVGLAAWAAFPRRGAGGGATRAPR